MNYYVFGALAMRMRKEKMNQFERIDGVSEIKIRYDNNQKVAKIVVLIQNLTL